MIQSAQCTEVTYGRLHTPERLSHVVSENRTRVSQRYRSVQAAKKRDSDRSFELSDRLTDRRLANVQFLRRPGKRSMPRSGVERS